MPIALSPNCSQADIVSNLNYLMAVVTSNRLGLQVGDWTIKPTATGNLIFTYNVVANAQPVMSLSSTGNLVITGNVIHGTPS